MAGLSPEVIARGIGDSTAQQIYKLEKSQRPLSHGWMVEIARVLEVRPAALIDAEVEFLPNAKSGGYLPEELERRKAIMLFWDLISRAEQDSILLSAKAFAASRDRAKG
jgi:hypothetical protein